MCFAGEIAKLLNSTGVEFIVASESSESTVQEAVKIINRPVKLFCAGVSKYGHPNVNEILSDKRIAFSEPENVSILIMFFFSYEGDYTKILGLESNTQHFYPSVESIPIE